ncbi:hypothetical protein [Flavobacterium sp.]|jgi:hypothetical protein|uniref:hypothetical protein n=1 Tax=Flavobacterium sp. TaxID=239 RepID=UPI0037BE5F62
MGKLSFIILLFITLFGYSQNQESEPTFYSEIAEKVASKAYYNVKFGNPSEVVVNDTIFMANSETWIEKNIYTFKSDFEMLVKKYRDNEFIADEIIQLDSDKRILKYFGNLKYEGEKWYITKVNYEYLKRKKIKEKMNDLGEIYMRYTVTYDSINNPTLIEHTIVGTDKSRLQNINYDYSNSQFIIMDFNYQGRLEEEIKGNINSNFVIETNDNGDVTKMYWILTDKKEPYIHEIDYEYDEKGNWIRLIKNVISPNGIKRPYHRTYRKIKYKN